MLQDMVYTFPSAQIKLFLAVKLLTKRDVLQTYHLVSFAWEI